MTNETYEADESCVFCGDNPRTVWESSNFRICSDPAPLTPGHALLFPKEHAPSAADIQTNVADEMDDIVAQISLIYEEKYGSFTMFEHGRTGHCLRSSSGERLCHHAHIHFLPIHLDLSDRAGIGQSREWRKWREIADLGSDTDGYALIDGTHERRLFHAVSHDLAPHYLRTCIAEATGVPERADWQEFARLPDALALAAASHRQVARLASALSARLSPTQTDRTIR